MATDGYKYLDCFNQKSNKSTYNGIKTDIRAGRLLRLMCTWGEELLWISGYF